MKKTLAMLLVVIFLLCFTAWGTHAQSERSNPMKQKWEYKWIKLTDADTEMNRMGEDGWELVGIMPAQWGSAVVFKRPK